MITYNLMRQNFENDTLCEIFSKEQSEEFQKEGVSLGPTNWLLLFLEGV